MSPPPATRIVLPALTRFEFKGASEYLEGLVAQIDTPQLDRICINYYNQLADFRAAQLSQFIDRLAGPETIPFKRADITFSSGKVTFDLYTRAKYHPSSRWCYARTTIMCEGIDWQVSHISQILSQFSTTLFSVVHLKLELELGRGVQFESTDDVEWLLLLHQFPTIQTLHVSGKLAVHLSLALEDVAGGMAAEVLPSVDLIWLAGRRIKKFVAARSLSGRPVTIISTIKEFNKRLESYAGK